MILAGKRKGKNHWDSFHFILNTNRTVGILQIGLVTEQSALTWQDEI